MNNVSELVITAITPNGSASLPFVIPSEAEGSAVSASQYQMLTGKPFCSSDFLPRGTRERSVCAFPQRKAHEVCRSHQVSQEIRGSAVERLLLKALCAYE
jgi:hypothetical protein